MKKDINNYEWNNIVKDILNNKEFKKIELCPHHKTNRLEHSKRVSQISYNVCKKLNLDYVSAARGGLLHDFFTNNYKDSKKGNLMKNHPKIASNNATKHFNINDKEKNIIESHMFPLNIKAKPKYIESIIISIVDKIACIYEKAVGYTSEFNFKVGKATIYMLLFLNS